MRAALLLLPPLFWAGNLVIGRAYAHDLPPIGLAFWRWIVALLCILPFVHRDLAAQWRALLRGWPVIVACGVSGFAGYPALNYLALHTTPAATAAILNSTLPLMVPLLEWIILGHRPAPRVIAGILVSFSGVAWIAGRGSWSTLAALSVGRGELLVLLAVACFALYTVLLRYRPGDVSPPLFLFGAMAAAAIALLPLWLLEERAGHPFPVDARSVAALLFIGIFASLVANAIWNHCAETLGRAVTGASFHLMAVYSSLLAFALLGEPVRSYHLAGMALILTGFALAASGRHGPRNAAAQAATARG